MRLTRPFQSSLMYLAHPGFLIFLCLQNQEYCKFLAHSFEYLPFISISERFILLHSYNTLYLYPLSQKEHPSKRIKYSEQRSSPSCKLTEVKLNSQHEKPTQQKHEVIKQTKELQRQQITLKQTNGFKSISRHHQSKSKKDLSLLKRKIKKPFKMTLTIPMEDTCRICESTLKELSDVTFNTVHNDEGKTPCLSVCIAKLVLFNCSLLSFHLVNLK